MVFTALSPARAELAAVLSHVTFGAVALFFFLYGAKLSLASIWAGLTNRRLKLGVPAATLLLFPMLTLGLQELAVMVLPLTVAIRVL